MSARYTTFSTVGLVACGIVLGSLLVGCFKPRPPVQRIEFSFAPKVPERPAPTNGRTLEVRLFDANPKSEGDEFVYRLSETTWENDFFHHFSQPPATLITFETRRWLLHSGLFESVSIPGLAPRGSWQLQGYLTELYADFTNLERPEVVMGLRIALYEPDAPASARPLMSETFHAREPFHPRTPHAMILAWDRALERILSQATNELRQTLSRPLPEPSLSPSPDLEEDR